MRKGAVVESQPTFTEREPYEKGFADVFARDIAPKLDDLERERLAIYQKRRNRIIIACVGYAVAAAPLIAVFNIIDFTPDSTVKDVMFIGTMIFLLATPLFLIHWVCKLDVVHDVALRDAIVPAICRFLGDLDYQRDPGERFDWQRFSDLGVVAGETKRFEDLFAGRHRGTAFKMVDALFRVGGGSASTSFDGLLFEIDVPVTFGGRVIIGRDKGRIGNTLKGFFKDKFGKESRIQFPDAAFEERYAVYASDSDEAMRLVSPGFCKNLVTLAEAYSEKSLGAAFVDGVFLLALPVEGDLFEIGSIKRSVYDCEEDIHEFLKQLTIAPRIIDYLHGDRPA